MDNFKRQTYRDTYWASLDNPKPFAIERPPAFSPAAAAQEQQSAGFMYWKFISEWIPWQYTNFFEESESFHNTAYLGDWSALPKLRVEGRDARKFLQQYTVNDLAKFAPHQIKHAIQVNEAGKVAGEGVLYRLGEEDYRYTGGAVYWLDHWCKAGQYAASSTIYTPDEFVFVVQGPKSIHILEKALGAGLRDLRFSYWSAGRIAGHEIRVLRTGITGELGYEVHGPVEIGNEIWLALTQSGRPYDLKLLGGRSQVVSHVEACFPTIGREFLPAVLPDTGKSRAHSIDLRGGSLEWTDPKTLLRSPFELNWDREVSLDTHDFLGRDTLRAERDAGGPARRLVGLIWNAEDVVDVYASLFREGPRHQFMELPRVSHKHAMDPDAVLKDRKLVGVSTSRVYSSFLRKMISLCHIDIGLREPGTHVDVVWGDQGSPQRQIRATVVELPFKPDRRRTDVRLLLPYE
jgi:glycine cleavage system aminomethyltransferase T